MFLPAGVARLSGSRDGSIDAGHVPGGRGGRTVWNGVFEGLWGWVGVVLVLVLMGARGWGELVGSAVWALGRGGVVSAAMGTIDGSMDAGTHARISLLPTGP